MGAIWEDFTRFDFRMTWYLGNGTRTFIFDGYTPTDALNSGQIPVQGSVLTVGTFAFVCTGVNVKTNTRPDAGEVTCAYATHSDEDTSFKPFSLSYKKKDQRVPSFVKGNRTYIDPVTQLATTKAWWYQQDTHVPVERAVYSVTCKIYAPGSTNNVIHQANLKAVQAQVSRLHQLPIFDGLWVMQPMSFGQVTYGFAEYVYSWEQDPGNSGFGNLNFTLPAGVPQPDPPYTDDDFVLAPARAPWFEYMVAQPRNPGDQPYIYQAPLFPNPLPGGGQNPYVQLNGWQTLPGNPFG